ncbi:hypothetical protein E2493_16995 [Sphingomonas parva]|uniref:Uncharacterized protein n=1 Tax=Sphingomonas parva TaxID=2555898 RepID=A0A4Y8ZP70_9SPHN|nr:hypothetical protein [Sphingomonas parva]TFI57052.1 hypothetical protein E2493_16995 [Sphingomonas parva]
MRSWAYLLGGLLVWTVHFFGLYTASSILLTSTTARVITALLTIVCLAIAGTLAARGWAGRARAPDEVVHWVHTIAALSGAIAFLAVLWQGLPALLI